MLDVLFAGLVGVILPLRAWRRGRRHAPPAPASRYIVETLLLTGTLAALLWRRGVPLQAIGLPPQLPWRLAGDVALCVAVVVGLDLWSFYRITRRIRHGARLPPPGETVTDALAREATLRSFIVVASVGAVWEELCFRATVFLLVPSTPAGWLTGIAGGTLLFGAQHLRNGRAGFAYASFFGLLFSLLYLATDDLAAVIIAHAAGNILAAAQWAPRIERARRQHAPRQASMFLG
jgi:membrane protease YdiL (CAAX protease family)